MPDSTSALRARTVLVVDDEPAIRTLLRAALESAGYRSIEAADGEGALELARQEPPDAILLDIALPGLSGLDVCRRLRGEAATARTPVLLLSGLGRPEELEAATEAGAQDCITKPFSPRAVIAQLEHSIR